MFLVKIVLKLVAFFHLYISKIIWNIDSLYRRSNKNKACLACGSTNTHDTGIQISDYDYFGYYERRLWAISFYYLIFFNFGFLKRIRFYLISKLKQNIGKALKINFLECNNCRSLSQDLPLNSKTSMYYEYAYRLSDIYARKGVTKENSKYHSISIFVDKIINDYYKNYSNLKLLDIGCAEGATLYFLNKKYKKLYGIEPSKPMINWAVQNFSKQINFVSGYYNSDSYNKNYFDCIFTYHVIEHVDNHLQFIKDISYHLKKGGLLILSTPDSQKGLKTFKNTKKIKDGYMFSCSHIKLFSQKYLSELLIENEFEIISKNKYINHENNFKYNKPSVENHRLIIVSKKL